MGKATWRALSKEGPAPGCSRSRAGHPFTVSATSSRYPPVAAKSSGPTPTTSWTPSNSVRGQASVPTAGQAMGPNSYNHKASASVSVSASRGGTTYTAPFLIWLFTCRGGWGGSEAES